MKFGKLLVTGGSGFLGSHFVRVALGQGRSVINLDLLTYAGDRRRSADVEGMATYRFEQGDIRDAGTVRQIIQRGEVEAVVHYAAESHVTRSENSPDLFFSTNTEGTRNLLDVSLEAGVQKFLHISTDEVYGPIASGAFREEDKLPGDSQATSPYAKSKSQADDIAQKYAAKIDVTIARPTNAFGPWQFPEKAFPRWITRALRGKPLPVWGDGLYVRQWLYAEDFANAIWILLNKGERGAVYNVGPRHEPEITNVDLAKWLVDYLGLSLDYIQHTDYDRPDHDRRYCVDSTRMVELGWKPGSVWNQFQETADWYVNNRAWWESHLGEAESIYQDVIK